MDAPSSQLTLGLLPEPRARWQKFVFSYGVQSLILTFVLVSAVMHPEMLEIPLRDYHFVSLVNNPPPVPQKPAPVRNFPPPKVTEVVPPRPEALRVPKELTPSKKVQVPEVQPPKVELAAKLDRIPDSKPVIPKQLVRTNVFSTGSSATPTMAADPKKVQTGGMGDPNGVPARENRGHAVTIAQLGSFDMPAGPGYGNGTGGAKGARGVVASAGFGNGVATGDGSGRVNTSRGNGVVRQAGFGDADPAPVQQARPKTAEVAPRIVSAEILSKPTPAYTDEARRLRVEGEVLLAVVLEASGHIRVVRVVRGLGHGLDESAIRAAEQINFKPAMRDGQPVDSTAVLHIIFQLA